MTIKTKLTLNVVIVLVIIVVVSATNIIGMGFVKNKLHYLTERSTPYQMATVEFQKAIQELASDLIKVSVSKSKKEFEAYRAEADKSMATVKEAQTALEELSGGAEIHLGITGLASELSRITGDRLVAEADAEIAKDTIVQKLKESSDKLHDLDKKVRSLQLNRSAAFISSMADTQEITGKLKNMQLFLLQLKDLQFALSEIDLVQEKKKLLILNGKLNALFSKTFQNDYLKSSKKFSADVKALSERITELIKLKSSLTGSPDVKADYDQSRKNVGDALSALTILIDQEVSLAGERYKLESARQETSLLQVNISNNVLGSNSELLSHGLIINGLTIRLFIAPSNNAIDEIEEEIHKSFGQMDTIAKNLEKGLTKLAAKDETQILNNAMQAVSLSRGLLFASDGIVSKIHHKMNMQEKALRVTEELRKIVLEQDEKGKETVIEARGDQQNAIGSVNKMVRFSSILMGIISTGAVVFGIAFGVWVYKSIAKPLNRLISASDEVAQGNLTCEISSNSGDEIATVQNSMSKMVSSLRDIVGKITTATGSLASSSEELSTTASVLDKGAHEQFQQVEQSNSAMGEISQAILDVAKNASETARTAQEMMDVAVHGKKEMDGTMTDLTKFVDSVKDSALKVESLGKKSAAIKNIVTLIKEIADQTNMLALNAAIEAARAGEQGRGFAIVADNVRQLAERTTHATDDIAKTVKTMETEIISSVHAIKEEKAYAENVLTSVKNTLRRIDEIVAKVSTVTDMVQKIAVATEEQTSTSEEVAHGMDNIAMVAKQLSGSVTEIKRSSEGLSVLAVELQTMSGFFRVD